MPSPTPTLDRVHLPADLKRLSDRALRHLADELRAETISAVSVTGGHLGAGLGVVELTVALHAVFDAPRDKIVAVTAAMPDGTGLDLFGARFPKRLFDVGIAEQHAVTFSAGLAAGGMKPFCAIYSTFLQRGYDQVVHDGAILRLPVRFAVDRAGLVGADGATHAGAFDVAFLANLPGFVVMAAADEAELLHMVATAAAHDAGPIAFRYPRGEAPGSRCPRAACPSSSARVA